MGELKTLPNIADKLEAQLHEVGIDSIETLKQTGSREAWLRIASIDAQAQAAGVAILSTVGRRRGTYQPDGSARGSNVTRTVCLGAHERSLGRGGSGHGRGTAGSGHRRRWCEYDHPRRGVGFTMSSRRRLRRRGNRLCAHSFT